MGFEQIIGIKRNGKQVDLMRSAASEDLLVAN